MNEHFFHGCKHVKFFGQGVGYSTLSLAVFTGAALTSTTCALLAYLRVAGPVRRTISHGCGFFMDATANSVDKSEENFAKAFNHCPR